jgi:hypothetical protein
LLYAHYHQVGRRPSSRRESACRAPRPYAHIPDRGRASGAATAGRVVAGARRGKASDLERRTTATEGRPRRQRCDVGAPRRRSAAGQASVILPDVNVLVYAFNEDARDHPRYAAWLAETVKAPEPERRRQDRDEPEDLRAPRADRPRPGLRRRARRCAELRADSPGTAPLADVHEPLPNGSCEGRQGDRRILRRAGTRVGERVDHHRSRLRPLSGAALAAPAWGTDLSPSAALRPGRASSVERVRSVPGAAPSSPPCQSARTSIWSSSAGGLRS